MLYRLKVPGVIGIFILIVNSLNAQNKPDTVTAVPLSLSEIWAKADAYSKVIKIQALKVAASEKEINDAKAAVLPELSVKGNLERASNLPMYENGLLEPPTQHNIIHTRYKIGSEAYFNLYNGNKTNLKISAENTRHQLISEQLHLSAADIHLRATTYYLDIQQHLQFRDLVVKNIAEQEKQLAQIRDFQKNGVVLNSDVLRAELKLSRQKMLLVQLENDITIASQKLNILIGEATNFRVLPGESTDTLPLEPAETYVNAALQHSHQYKISAQQTTLSKIKVQDIKGNLAPKAGLYAEYNYAYPQTMLYPYAAAPYGFGIIGIKAAFPVSGFYHNKNKVAAARIELSQQTLEQQHLEEDLRQQINEARIRYEEDLQRITVARENVVQATENYRIVTNTYANQTALITDLLDADVQLLQTKFELSASLVAARLQYYKLQYIIGDL